MKTSKNLINILSTLYFKGIGKAWIVKNRIWEKSKSQIINLISDFLDVDDVTDDFESFSSKVQKIVDGYENIADGIICIGDKEFPELRGNVNNSDYPIVLAYKGDINLLNRKNKNVAVIGVLNPQPEIETRERKFVKTFVENGFTIVSGLALGCDSISHTEALNQGGKTIAILPSTLKNIQPKVHISLANQIVENNGLIVTEYLSEAVSKQAFVKRFVERDRLQAYFSDCVILAASYDQNPFGNDCGSRHALNNALKAGIKRAVMYNPQTDSNNPQFDLNRRIINEDKKQALIITDEVSSLLINKIKGVPQATEQKLF